MSGNEERIAFEIEVERDADPITGVLRLDGGEFVFVGWVALAGALERILKSEETTDQKESVK